MTDDPPNAHTDPHTRPDTNSDTDPHVDADADPRRDRPGAASPGLGDRPGIRDAVFGLLLMFPAAALMALVYRFPLPFGAVATGMGGAWEALWATLVYGLTGGFVVVPLIAVALGSALRRRGGGRGLASALLPAAAAAALYALVLGLSA